MVEATRELVNGIDETVDRSESSGIDIGEEFAGSNSVGSIKGEVSNIGFESEGAREEVGAEIFVKTNKGIADDGDIIVVGDDFTVIYFNIGEFGAI